MRGFERRLRAAEAALEPALPKRDGLSVLLAWQAQGYKPAPIPWDPDSRPDGLAGLLWDCRAEDIAAHRALFGPDSVPTGILTGEQCETIDERLRQAR